jgi:hypothetical protein
VSTARTRLNRGLWRGVYSSLTSHPDFQALSPRARLVFFVIRLGTQNTIASIFRYYREPLMAETGLSARALEQALCELASKPSPDRPWIVRDATVLWIRNGLAFDPTLTLSNPSHLIAIRRAVSALPHSSPIVQAFKIHYDLLDGVPREGDREGDRQRDREGDREGGLPVSLTITSTKTTPITKTTPVTTHGGSLLLVSKQNPSNDSDAPLRRPASGEYQAVWDRIRAKHPHLAAAEVDDEALRAFQAGLQ